MLLEVDSALHLPTPSAHLLLQGELEEHSAHGDGEAEHPPEKPRDAQHAEQLHMPGKRAHG